MFTTWCERSLFCKMARVSESDDWNDDAWCLVGHLIIALVLAFWTVSHENIFHEHNSLDVEASHTHAHAFLSYRMHGRGQHWNGFYTFCSRQRLSSVDAQAHRVSICFSVWTTQLIFMPCFILCKFTFCKAEWYYIRASSFKLQIMCMIPLKEYSMYACNCARAYGFIILQH